MAEAMLRSEALCVGYRGETVVADVALAAEPGQVLTLIGPNGAGKSTILKTLTGQLPPVGGALLLEGQDLRGLRERDVAKRMAAVLTGRPQPELMSCRDVVASGRYPYTGRLGILSAHDRVVCEESMALVRVTELADRDFNRISDGQRQRVLLARAICQEPRVLILDEPTSFLDIRHKLEFLSLLRELAMTRQIAVVLSLHELDLAQRFSDHILCIRDGRVDRAGPPEEIFTPGYIEALYGVERGSFDPLFGSAESEGLSDPPKLFVIGGGGAGIPVYRRLQRLRIPFAAGVLPENDLDYPVAKALAAELISEPAFAEPGEAALARAEACLLRCGACLCAVERFGPANAGNRRLRERAEERGLLIGPEQLEELRK